MSHHRSANRDAAGEGGGEERHARFTKRQVSAVIALALEGSS